MSKTSKKNAGQLTNALNSEGGFVILLVVGLFALVIMAAVAYFMYVVPISKKVSAQLRREVDSICANLSSSTLQGKELEDLFFDSVSRLNIKNGKIIRAVIYFNEVTDDATFFDQREFSSALGGLGAPTRGPTGPGQGVWSVTGPGCGSDYTCYSIGSLGTEFLESGGAGGDKYARPDAPDGDLPSAPTSFPVPSGLILASYYSGNFVGCEITARPDANLFTNLGVRTEDSYATARLFYQRVPINFQPAAFNPAVAGSDSFNSSSPKLTVIIDPYGQTTTQLPGRFGPPIATDGFASALQGGTFETGVDLALDGTADEAIGRVPIRAPAVGNAATGLPGVTHLGNPYPATELAERNLACYNTPARVRNNFLYHFFSFVLRDGFFRDNTSVYMTQPQHRMYFGDDPNATYGSSHLFHPGILNPPSFIAGALGSGSGSVTSTDLLEDTIEIPYLSFIGTLYPTDQNGDNALNTSDEYGVPRVYFHPDGPTGALPITDAALTDWDTVDPTDPYSNSGSKYDDILPMMGIAGNVSEPPRDAEWPTSVQVPEPTLRDDHRYAQAYTQPFIKYSAPNPLTSGERIYPYRYPAEDDNDYDVHEFDGLEGSGDGTLVDSFLENQMEYHSIVSGQLRDCFHLYRPTTGGIQINDAWFDPPGFNDRAPIYGVQDPQTNLTPASGDIPWDQTAGSGVNILEFVGMLGMAQQCPQAAVNPAFPDTRYAESNKFCFKPQMTTAVDATNQTAVKYGDFRGDVFAALAHIANRSAADLTYNTPASPAAVAAAGGALATGFTTPAPNIGLLRSPYCLFGTGAAAPCNGSVSSLTDARFSPVAGAVYASRDGSLNQPETYDAYDPPPGDNIILIVTHQAPGLEEIDLWRKYLTGNWKPSNPSDEEEPWEQDAEPVWKDTLYSEYIFVVHIPMWDDSHDEADASHGSWLSAISGAPSASALGVSTTSGIPNFFPKRRRVFYIGPFGGRRFGLENAGAALTAACTPPRSSNTPESCNYGFAISPADTAYQTYYQHLLAPASSGPGDSVFDGNIKERARQVFDAMQTRRPLF